MTAVTTRYTQLSLARDAFLAAGADSILIQEQAYGGKNVFYKIVTEAQMLAHCNATPKLPPWHEVNPGSTGTNAYMDIDGMPVSYSTHEEWTSAKQTLCTLSKFAIRLLESSFNDFALVGITERGKIHCRVYDSSDLVPPAGDGVAVRRKLSLHVVAFCESHYFLHIPQMLMCQWAALALADFPPEAVFLSPEGTNKLCIDQQVYDNGQLRALGSYAKGGDRRKVLRFSCSESDSNEEQFRRFVSTEEYSGHPQYDMCDIRDSLLFANCRATTQPPRQALLVIPGAVRQRAEAAKKTMATKYGLTIRRRWPTQLRLVVPPTQATHTGGNRRGSTVAPVATKARPPHGSVELMQFIATNMHNRLDRLTGHKTNMKDVKRVLQKCDVFDLSLQSTSCFVETDGKYCPHKGGRHAKNTLHYHTISPFKFKTWCRSDHHDPNKCQIEVAPDIPFLIELDAKRRRLLYPSRM